MTWTRLSDDFTDRRDLMRCSRSARLLHIEALVHCNRLLTDGHLLRAELRRITDADDLGPLCAELEAVGLWTRTEDGWQMLWDDQEPADLVQHRQALNRTRQERKRRHDAGHHGDCNPKYCKAADRDRRHADGDHEACTSRDCADVVTRDVTRDVTEGVTGVVTAPRPVPARPGPKEPGKGRTCGCGARLATDGTCARDPEHDAVRAAS